MLYVTTRLMRGIYSMLPVHLRVTILIVSYLISTIYHQPLLYGAYPPTLETSKFEAMVWRTGVFRRIVANERWKRQKLASPTRPVAKVGQILW